MLFAVLAAVFLILWGVMGLLLPRAWVGVGSLANRFAALSMRYGVVQRAIHSTSRFRDYLPVALVVVVGLGIAGVAGDKFIDLAELVHAQNPALEKADLQAHDWAVTKRTKGATLFFDTMSNVGGPVGVGAIVVVALAALLLSRHFSRAGYLAITTAGGGLLDWELKRYFARARPDIAQALQRASGYSFPSGHAMGSAVVFGALGYVAFRTLKTWRWKAAAIALGLTMIVSVALSRVYLGVHWISDVTAGVVCGLVWVTITTVAFETFRRIHLIRVMRDTREAASQPD